MEGRQLFLPAKEMLVVFLSMKQCCMDMLTHAGQKLQGLSAAAELQPSCSRLLVGWGAVEQALTRLVTTMEVNRS